MPDPGLYETLLTRALAERLDALDDDLVARKALGTADAPDRLALHLSRVVARAVAHLPETQRVERGIGLARRLIEALAEDADADSLRDDLPLAETLAGVWTRQPDGRPKQLDEPLLPLLDTTLLSNAPGEPRVVHQIGTEVDSADRIDVIMAFIRRSGLRKVDDALRRHCSAGKPLRVLTTTFTGSTEREALDQLSELGAEVRVSYDETTTRLHAKAWLFHRRSGFSTAYVGSSNLSHAGVVEGLEWNVRLSGVRNAAAYDKMVAVFDSYWHCGDFEPFDADAFARRTHKDANSPRLLLGPEFTLRPFQEAMLERLAVAREAGHHRNLMVSATGTGKTVMAAVDYTRLRDTLPRARLLFVAHRREILAQSQVAFAYAMRDTSFGELWGAGRRPDDYEHVFATVQSLASADLANLKPDHFDVVIIDEFHHADAPTYRRLLEHLEPRELLGLTATPERADGVSVAQFFGGRITAELRLWDAVDAHYLAPFSYFGVADDADLRGVRWRRGQGYDVEDVSNVLTADDARARRVLAELRRHIADLSTLRAIGFCVSVAHARFMARVFSESGVAATAVTGDTPAAERDDALRSLRDGNTNVLFAVDLFNEGVDVPAVDTLILLRPTDSATVFIQQLGRGLRLHPGKSECLVLDFVAQHVKEFRFENRYRALLGGDRRQLKAQIEQGFPYLPAGCHMALDRVSRERVLANLRQAVPSHWRARVEALRAMAPDATLADYLDETGLELGDVYAGNRCWSDLLDAADRDTRAAGQLETELRRAVGRQMHVDDRLRLTTWRTWLAVDTPPVPADASETRLLRMLLVSLLPPTAMGGLDPQAAAALLWSHAQVRAEL